MKLRRAARSERPRSEARLSDTIALLLGAGLCLTVAGLLALSYLSLREWRRSSEMLAEQRAEVALALLSTALNKDMKGAQFSVLLPLELEDMVEPPDDLLDIVARAFARFPYPESFFVWRSADARKGAFYLFNRSERPPAWDMPADTRTAYPAVMERDPAHARALVQALQQRVVPGKRFLLFDCALDGMPYQVVARTVPGTNESVRVVGFTINVAWVREHYFRELVREVSNIADVNESLSIGIEDEQGRVVAATRPFRSMGPVRERPFSPMFFDAAMLSTLAPGTPAKPLWKARVDATDDPMLSAARGATVTTNAVLAAAAIASVVGLLLTSRAVRARAVLAAMQSDFIATVTHELKTPLASIRLMGETLGRGRYESVDTVQDYARMLSQETVRLTRLIDNLLMYARVVDRGRRSHDEPIELAELVEDVLERFRPQLASKDFDVTIDVPSDLPRIRGDRAALFQALENLVDNAIKYAEDGMVLSIRSAAERNRVRIEVVDRGVGISSEEIPRVFEKFYRGRATRVSGSGLGLAIVKRVVEEHGGTAEIVSGPQWGTTVRLVLPLDVRGEPEA
jgi:signal transduction histidine kinase